MVAATDRYGNASFAGELIDHHDMLVNDALCLDDRIMESRVSGADRFNAERREDLCGGPSPCR